MIKFSKFIWLYIVLSSLVIVPGTYSLIRFGLLPAVDFTGGTLVELKFSQGTSSKAIENAAKQEEVPMVSVQQTMNNTYIIRLGNMTDEKLLKFENRIAQDAGVKPEILRKDTVGPILGSELLKKSIAASAISILVILCYVAYVFKSFKFGFAAIVSLIHDALVVIGSFSLFGYFFHVEVDTLFMTAFLTTMSLSVHDTVVIFDRIREYRRKDTKSDFVSIVDVALTEVIDRSLVTSFTIIFMLLALVLMGGESIRWFAVALLIGTITGIYSSPFVATPVLILLNKWEEKKKHH